MGGGEREVQSADDAAAPRVEEPGDTFGHRLLEGEGGDHRVGTRCRLGLLVDLRGHLSCGCAVRPGDVRAYCAERDDGLPQLAVVDVRLRALERALRTPKRCRDAAGERGLVVS